MFSFLRVITNAGGHKIPVRGIDVSNTAWVGLIEICKNPIKSQMGDIGVERKQGFVSLSAWVDWNQVRLGRTQKNPQRKK